MRLGIVIACLGMFACAHGQSPVPAGSVDAYPDVQSFCEARAQAECSKAVVTACGVKDAATCEAARAASCEAQQPQGTTYVAKNAPACVDLVKQTYAATTLTADDLNRLATTCGTQVFSGPGAARAPCGTPYDCSSADGLTCVVPLGATSGKCLAPAEAQPGGACADEQDVCVGGSYCDPKSKTCTMAASLGEACQSGWTPCGEGLTCGGDGSPFARCGPKGADGHACTLGSDCASGLCDKAAQQAEGTCASTIALTPLDSQCVAFKGQ